jgi:DNA-binding NtrC family response regulator
MVRKILIVEDEVDLADLIHVHFARAGWETVLAENGEVALQRIEEFKPDVILSDITMPVMDGMALLEEMDKRHMEIPLIFLSGFRDVEKMKRAWGLCAFDFLDKPMNEKALIQVAENAFEFGREYVRAARKRYLSLRRVS